MKTTIKAKFTSFIEGPAPIIIISAGAAVASLVLYNKFLSTQADSYNEFLIGLMGQSERQADGVIEAVVERLNK